MKAQRVNASLPLPGQTPPPRSSASRVNHNTGGIWQKISSSPAKLFFFATSLVSVAAVTALLIYQSKLLKKNDSKKLSNIQVQPGPQSIPSHITISIVTPPSPSIETPLNSSSTKSAPPGLIDFPEGEDSLFSAVAIGLKKHSDKAIRQKIAFWSMDGSSLKDGTKLDKETVQDVALVLKQKAFKFLETFYDQDEQLKALIQMEREFACAEIDVNLATISKNYETDKAACRKLIEDYTQQLEELHEFKYTPEAEASLIEKSNTEIAKLKNLRQELKDHQTKSADEKKKLLEMPLRDYVELIEKRGNFGQTMIHALAKVYDVQIDVLFRSKEVMKYNPKKEGEAITIVFYPENKINHYMYSVNPSTKS